MALSIYPQMPNYPGNQTLYEKNITASEQNSFDFPILDSSISQNRAYVKLHKNGYTLGVNEKPLGYILGEKFVEPFLKKISTLSNGFFHHCNVQWQSTSYFLQSISQRLDKALTFPQASASKPEKVLKFIDARIEKIEALENEELGLVEQISLLFPWVWKNERLSSYPGINHLEKKLLQIERKIILNIGMEDLLKEFKEDKEFQKDLPVNFPFEETLHNLKILIAKKDEDLMKIHQDYLDQINNYYEKTNMDQPLPD